MDKIIVPFEDVRGLGNIVSPKSLEDFEEYLSSVSKGTETINDVEMEVYTLVGNSNKIVLTADYNSIDYGDIVHLTAVVTDFEDNPITDLTVSFYDGETLLGTATCNQYNQEYYFTVYDALSTGIHNIVAKATIDDIMVSSNIQGITVNKLTSSITLSGNDIEYGEDIELTGTLSIGSGYTVKIYQDDVLVDTVMTSANGSFSSTISNLNIGEYNFRAVFEETEIYLNSDDTVQLNVYSAIPTLSLSSSSDNLLKGESYTLSGNLSAGAGTVKLYNGDTLIDTVTAGSNGNFSKTITGVVDVYKYKAVFEGNENYGRCTSNDVNVKVLTANPVELTIVGNKFTQVRSSEIVLINSSNEKIVIDYGDNTIQVYTGDYTHNYSVSGTYNVKIYNVTSFGNECFAYLDGQWGSLTEITIPEGITTIGDYCFRGTDLTSLIIPSTVTSIGMYALQSGFTQITLPWTVSSNIVQYRSIWNYAGWASGFKFIIPEGTTSLYTAKNYPSNLLKELFDSIDLSSDKDIISYNGGTNPEHAVLTAQLMSGDDPATIEGKTVTFEVRKQSDDSLVETLSDVTDGSGVATVSYTSNGAGDLYIKAECSLVSKTYDVQDIFMFDDCTSEKHNWAKGGNNTTYSFTNNGLSVKGSTGGCYLKLNETLPSNYSVEFEITGMVSSGSFRGSSIVCEDTFIEPHTSNTILASMGQSNKTSSTLVNVGDIIKIDYNGTQSTYYINGTSIGYVSEGTDGFKGFQLRSVGASGITIKDLKIREL